MPDRYHIMLAPSPGADQARWRGSPLTRPYVSRLEKHSGSALSSLRRLSVALGAAWVIARTVPSEKELSREELDGLARGALRPEPRRLGRPEVRVLARMLQDRRKALGLYIPRKRTPAERSDRPPTTRRDGCAPLSAKTMEGAAEADRQTRFEHRIGR